MNGYDEERERLAALRLEIVSLAAALSEASARLAQARAEIEAMELVLDRERT